MDQFHFIFPFIFMYCKVQLATLTAEQSNNKLHLHDVNIFFFYQYALLFFSELRSETDAGPQHKRSSEPLLMAMAARKAITNKIGMNKS